MANILPFINILVSFGDRIEAHLLQVILWLDATAYSLVAYSFRVFQLMCTVNYNSIMGIVSPIVESLQSVMIVYVVFILGKSFVEYMLDPEKAAEGGKKLLVNIFIATALFVSYNWIFSAMNEVNIALLGNSTGYKYTTLDQVFDLKQLDEYGANDEGVVMRVLFGKDKIDDPGATIAVNLAGVFYRDAGGVNYETMKSHVCPNNECDMEKLSSWNFAVAIAEDNVDYTKFASLGVALFVIYSMFSAALQVGIRMFKLLILQVLAPIPIVDVVKNGVGGDRFKTYIKNYSTVFFEAFIRMFTIMLITVFVSKFLIHIDSYFPSLSSDTSSGVLTKGLIKVIVVIAAYTFAGQAPDFIGKALKLENASNATKGMGFLKGVIGGGIGAVTGAVGGAIGGGLGGALAGLGGGAVNGFKTGSKGQGIADMFKTGASSATGAVQRGKDLRLRGNGNAMAGLGMGIAGAAQNLFGVGRRQDKELELLDKKEQVLKDLDAAEAYAVKDSKMQNGESWTDSDGNAYSASDYINGYDDVKLGEDKDSYASKMLQYDAAFQQAQSEYDFLQNDTSEITAAEEQVKAATSAFSAYSSDYDAYQYLTDTINNTQLADQMGTTYTDRSGQSHTISTEADLEAWKQDGIAAANDTFKDAVAAHTSVEQAENNLKTKNDKRKDDIIEAKKNVQKTRYEAEKRAKAYYDDRKKREADKSLEVQRTRATAKSLNLDTTMGKTRQNEKRRLHEERTKITTSSSYANTHGKSKNSKS